MQRLVRSPWADVATAAGFSFLVVCSIGALLLVGLKLQAPSLGAGASAPSILAGIVIVGLACLGTPTQIGDVSVSLLPLGGLLAIAVATSWSAAGLVRKIDAPRLGQRVAWGAALGVPLGLICGAAALVFRIRDSAEPVLSQPTWALGLGLFWGALFGGLGALASMGSLASLGPLLAQLRTRAPMFHDGLKVAITVLAVALVTAGVASLAWVVLFLAGGAVGEFGAADALAGIIHFALFAPNAFIWTTTISLGAPLELAAGLAGAARSGGIDHVLSLWSWPGGTPWYAYTLLAIPAAAGLAGGVALARSEVERPIAALGVGAVGVAITIFILASISGARVAPGLLRPRAFAYVAPDSKIAAALSAAWVMGGGATALMLESRRRRVPVE
ncbi:MAG: hypothetical protein ABR505_10610 [Actinomycetota bacterium]